MLEAEEAAEERLEEMEEATADAEDDTLDAEELLSSAKWCRLGEECSHDADRSDGRGGSRTGTGHAGV